MWLFVTATSPVIVKAMVSDASLLGVEIVRNKLVRHVGLMLQLPEHIAGWLACSVCVW
jgi:hypothetical protein